MRPDREQFGEQVQDAFRHLQDVAYLREHPLLDRLSLDPAGGPKERGFALQQLMLDAVDELRPGPDVPPDSLHWRRYRLLDYRYRKALDPRATARELGISRRQFYRDHAQAMERLINQLWNRAGQRFSDADSRAAVPSADDRDQVSGEEERLALLRVEVARLARAARTSRVQDVVDGTLPLLRPLLEIRNVQVSVDLPSHLPDVAIEPALLRQMVLAVLSCLGERARDAVLKADADVQDDAVRLCFALDPPLALEAEDPQETSERLAALQGMAAPCDAAVRVDMANGGPCRFELLLPQANRLVLVVDDNQDILALFQRHLSPHAYQVLTAQSADEAIVLAERYQPYAITLDLLMPEADGWDLLQTLLHRPRTRHIPVIVCSVLRQRELALSLGATAFLIKPVTEQALLGALEALEERPSA
jgi:CheY-like chemotaxis protein